MMGLLHSTKQTVFTPLCLLTGFTITCSLPFNPPAIAQIIPDNSLGSESSVVVPNQNIRGIESDRIDGGAIRGSNLFHSFQEFNIDNGRGAYFSNPENISNILTRVTGNNLSNILGTLGVLGNANLFLINPNGIVFGPNARLDVGGSFFASTADSILFENGVEFAASNPDAPPLLTINIPIGLNFRENPGNIVNQSIAVDSEDNLVGLQVLPRRTLGLVGGDIQLENSVLTASQGRIELGSVAENSTVSLTPIDKGYALSYENVPNFQDILLSLGIVNVQGEGGGDIQIQGRQVTLTDGSIISASTQGSEPGGLLSIQASESVEVIGSSIFVDVNPGATGNGGNVLIETQQLTVKEGADISASTRGSGNAGSLTIRADEVEISGEFSSISSQVNRSATGQGGVVTIESGQLIVQDRATLSVNTLGSGQGGIFTVNTRQLFVNNQGQILGVTDELGQGGTININASEFIELSDNSLISGTSTNLSQAQAGNITVETGRLTVEDDSGIVVDTLSPGRGGQLTIRAEQLIINNNSVVSALSSGLGQAGTINVNASEFIELSDGSGITTQTQQQGDANAGDITVETGRLTVQNGSQINNSTSGSGNAGNITVSAEQIELMGRGENPSAIQSNVEEIEGVRGAGNGGNIIIEAQQLTIKENAGISASTRGSGNAGSLTIRAAEVEITGESSSIGSQVNRGATGQGGVVTIESGQLIIQDRGIISVGTLSTGQSGRLTINTGRLIVQGGGSITARTEGSGQGGTIDVNASESILVRGSAIFSDGRLNPSSLETTTFTSAKAGDLTIATGQLIIEDGGQITASTSGSGEGGNVTVQASDIELIGTFNDGQQEAPSGLFVDVGPNATGRGGALAVNTDRLILREGAQIDASTLGSGSGGELTIRANEIELIGRSASGRFPSGLFTGVNSGIEDFNNEATGNAGELNIEAERLTLKDGAEISVETSSIGNAGNLIINANEIKISGFAEGERLSAISARTTKGSQGNGGTLEINSEVVSVENQAQIVVSSQGEGVAGNLNINAPNIFLDNQASLNGETTAGEGDIILNTEDLRLRNNSSITTNATGEATGGNITINTETLTALEDSDISANAEDAFGGRVTINAIGVFGTAFRTQQTRFSDITATSELGPEFSGTVELNTELDPSSGLIDLTQTVVDPSDLIAQEFCRQRGGSEFVVTGKGGLAADPNDKADGNQIEVDLVEPVPTQPRNSSQRRSEVEDNQPVSSLDIVPARGWIRDENGDVILVSYDPTKTGVQRQPAQLPQCQPGLNGENGTRSPSVPSGENPIN